jgi:hypothetical protein
MVHLLTESSVARPKSHVAVQSSCVDGCSLALMDMGVDPASAFDRAEQFGPRQMWPISGTVDSSLQTGVS